MAVAKTRSEKWFDAAIAALMVLILAIIVYPLLVVISSSLSNPVAVANGRVLLFPVEFTLRSFGLVFRDSSLVRGYGNSIAYTLVGTVVNLLVTTTAAYALAKREFYLRR
ncbi:MAG TPA: carbohydrate ABC transporter permease, partial [Clostridia bacterium]|nr:carbohydrate ABC transporter permease [Clostridia bacterium]